MINGNFATSGLSLLVLIALALTARETIKRCLIVLGDWDVPECMPGDHRNNGLQLHGPGKDEINLILVIYFVRTLNADFSSRYLLRT